MLIQNGQWHVTVTSLAHIWQLLVKTDIHAQGSIAHAQGSDYWIWTETTQGNFTFTSNWNVSRVVDQEFEFQSIIWYPAHCPKMAICLPRALLEKLLIRDKVVQFGIIQTNICPLCNILPEPINHLFFECSYASYIRALCKLKLRLSQTNRLNAE